VHTTFGHAHPKGHKTPPPTLLWAIIIHGDTKPCEKHDFCSLSSKMAQNGAVHTTTDPIYYLPDHKIVKTFEKITKNQKKIQHPQKYLNKVKKTIKTCLKF
jgi:hypothetical protein